MTNGKRHSLSITNSISWDPGDSDPDRRAPLRLALDAFICAISMLDGLTMDDVRWFKQELDTISERHLGRSSSSGRWEGSGSGWSGSR